MTTLQEFFDKTITHLQSMSQRAMFTGGDTCSYLNRFGDRCAVGVHLPGDDDLKLFRGRVRRLLEAFPGYSSYLRPSDHPYDWTNFWADMQFLHDASDNWDKHGFRGWNAAAIIARQYNLNCEAFPK